MEPEDSLPRLQEPAICPYPEPDESRPCLPTIPFLENPFQYYPPIYDWVFEVVSVPHISLPNPLLSPIRATCPAHLIILDLITTVICILLSTLFSDTLKPTFLPQARCIIYI
jgi:hypothetical protein